MEGYFFGFYLLYDRYCSTPGLKHKSFKHSLTDIGTSSTAGLKIQVNTTFFIL